MGHSADAALGYGVIVPQEFEYDLPDQGYDDIYDLLWAAENAVKEKHGNPDPNRHTNHPDFVSWRDFHENGSWDEHTAHIRDIQERMAEDDEEARRTLAFRREWEEIGLEYAFVGTALGGETVSVLLVKETMISADWSYPTEIDALPDAPSPKQFRDRLRKCLNLVGVDAPDFGDPCWLLCVAYG